MRKLNKNLQPSFGTLIEIRRALRNEVEKLWERTGMMVEGEKSIERPQVAHLLNWLTCWYLTRPPAERDRIAREGKPIFDARRHSDVAIDFNLDEIKPVVPLEAEPKEGTHKALRRKSN